MKVIAQKRRTGKTTELVDMLIDDPYMAIVVLNSWMATDVRNRLRDRLGETRAPLDAEVSYKMREDRIFSLSPNIREELRRANPTKVAVDEAQAFLGQMLGYVPEVVTISEDQ